ncbi:MAG: hypothetical protein P1U61_01025 [Legionellaceae bacterium]|nr:hypothetical protein [Legionellaceae bacterium]
MPRMSPNMLKTLGRAAMLGSGAAATYVGHDTIDYFNLKRSLPTSEAPIRTDRPTITAQNKDWTLFGRQSPGFVRDPKKNPKDVIRKKIVTSPLIFDALGTRMDNEKHFALFEGTDFRVEPMTSDAHAPQVDLPPEKMKSTNLDDLPEDALYEIGFARKQGFADFTEHSPFYHSSIALREISPTSPASEGALIMTGSEVRDVMKKTDDYICGRQHCTLVQSNCYTASVYAMGQMIETIDARSGDPSEHSADIQKVSDVMTSAAFENFGRGISNNGELSDFLTEEVTPIIKKHQALTAQIEAKVEATRETPSQDKPDSSHDEEEQSNHTNTM